jgi:heme O synthase-like polyprenyltransferase
MTVGVVTNMMIESEDDTKMEHLENRAVVTEKAVWPITGCSTGFASPAREA